MIDFFSFLSSKLLTSFVILLAFAWPLTLYAIFMSAPIRSRIGRRIWMSILTVIFTILYINYGAWIWPDPADKHEVSIARACQIFVESLDEFKIRNNKRPPVRTDLRVELHRFELLSWNPPKHFYVTLEDTQSHEVFKSVYVSKHCNSAYKLKAGEEYNLQRRVYTMSDQPGRVFYEFIGLYDAFCGE